MKTVNTILGSVAMLGLANAALAAPTFVNFQAMADGAYGESAFAPLSLLNDFGVNVDINGTFNGQQVYAYLDAGEAGLGVCRDLNQSGDGKLNTKQPGSRANLCGISSDDNVNTYAGLPEGLEFSFNQDLSVTRIWFNNNHDPDYGMSGDTVVVDGTDHTFSAADRDSSNSKLGWIYDFSGTDGFFMIGDTLTIDYFIPGQFSQLRGEEFYISAIEFDEIPSTPDVQVPVPSTLLLLAAGLVGFSARARRTKRLS